ncbi:MAG: hypothetical protein GXO58_07585 [Thermodesulfobacteria bacterium]|nr:hypothetical protein [Thermodesulfobacteriota bacterium]
MSQKLKFKKIYDIKEKELIDYELVFDSALEIFMSHEELEDVDYEESEDYFSWADDHAEALALEIEEEELERQGSVQTSNKEQAVQTSGAVSPQDVAWQKARVLAEEFGYGDELSALLYEIFRLNRHGQTFHAVRRRLSAGAGPERLRFIWKIRQLWSEYPEFSNGSAEPACWSLCSDIADLYDSYPDIAEVEQLLLHLYEQWRYRPSLFSEFRSFSTFVGYKVKYDPGMELAPLGLLAA